MATIQVITIVSPHQKPIVINLVATSVNTKRETMRYAPTGVTIVVDYEGDELPTYNLFQGASGVSVFDLCEAAELRLKEIAVIEKIEEVPTVDENTEDAKKNDGGEDDTNIVSDENVEIPQEEKAKSKKAK